VISRLAQQKGIDLVFDALPEIENQSWQLALLGAGDSQLEGLARFLASQFPQRVSASIKYDDALARRIYAGSDMILIPSRYEPCGLTQMIAMRYGCIPVARAVGGLKDTIDDHGSGQDGTGFLFSEPTAHALAGAISRALSIYSDQAAWHSLQRRAMAQDFSWANSAQQYDELYQSLIK
jgi:starch synthase